MNTLQMVLLVCLCWLLVGGKRLLETTRTPKQRQIDQLSKADLVKVVSHFIADKVGEKRAETKRTGRQLPPGFSNPLGVCEVVGFETNYREECEEVSTVECKRINVTVYRPEIRERCRTSFDQSCNVTYKDVPTDKCSPRLRNK